LKFILEAGANFSNRSMFEEPAQQATSLQDLKNFVPAEYHSFLNNKHDLYPEGIQIMLKI